ncbi:PepSY domain-containing protein [Breznakiella homolactica]|uniref:PepSY domain-containing protein n=1 Tax=Breznakiella homolactica TaxID=2798577 RepID=A0A7T7XM68_9SPIR|nr:PepSY domain-containing protein [Breznakiella homolactica]QQO08803.1 PepSY domain-containing protein [Breznakiella homolactica]
MKTSKKTGIAVFLCIMVLLPAGLFAQTSRTDIGFDKAEEIALAQAGGGTVVSSELDRHDRFYYYEIEIIKDNERHEFEIGSDDGLVYEHSIKQVRNIRRTSTARTAEISQANAEAIALERAGGGRITRSKLDREDGILVYEINISDGDTRYELDIDAVTGDVVSYEMEVRYRR